MQEKKKIIEEQEKGMRGKKKGKIMRIHSSTYRIVIVPVSTPNPLILHANIKIIFGIELLFHVDLRCA